jgi:arginyl-tRNA synthetase
MIWDDLRQRLNETLVPWAKRRGLDGLPSYSLEEPPAGIESDVACNLALIVAKPLQTPPRAIAEELRRELSGSIPFVEDITVAGAGFLNFRWTLPRLHEELRTLLSERDAYGRRSSGARQKVLIEFVSANPTGPLHVGHGRGAALGDSLALILSHLGDDVAREYYLNDAGNQVQLLGESLLARARELEGKPPEMPDQGYHGDYVRDLAKDFVGKVPPEARNVEQAIQFGLERLQEEIAEDLRTFGVRFDSWLSEKDLVKRGKVDQVIAELSRKGFTEEAEGALWFVSPVATPSPLMGEGKDGGVPPPRSSPTRGEEVRDKNRVLKRQDGRWTYFATDIAYHANKFARGFDRLINIWGADHHGYVARVKGSMQALGHDPSRLHIILNQMVALTRQGVPVAMSKRSGEFVTLREVVEEVGKDACRFFFALRGPNSPLEFDLELAKKQTVDNPVYYLQYAHARICSIFRQAEANNSLPPWWGKAQDGGDDVKAVPPTSILPHKGGGKSLDLFLLKEKEERDLMKRLALFPQVLQVCFQEDSPHPLANYLLLLARQFHYFYDHHRVLGNDPPLTQARLGLVKAVQTLLRLGLSLLGVSAPSSM